MTTRKHAFYGILTLVSLLGLGRTQSAKANLITNGDFETGDFTGWTVTHGGFGSNIHVSHNPAGLTPHSAQFLRILAINSTRLVKPLPLHRGLAINLSFFYQIGNMNPVDLADNHFVVLFNGVSIYDNLNANPGYGTFTFNNLLVTGRSTTLEFKGLNTPSYDFLDNVSVTPAGVPDAGSTLPLLSFASLGLVALCRKLSC